MNNYRGIGGGGFPYKSNAAHGVTSLNAVPPPSSLNSSRNRRAQNYFRTNHNNALGTGNLFVNNSQYAIGKRKLCTEDDYFNDDEELNTNSMAYQPAPGSPGPSKKSGNNSTDSDDDPLDKFMAGIEKQVRKETQDQKITSTAVMREGATDHNMKGVRQDIDDVDNEESYYKFMKDNPNAGLQNDGSDVEFDYDSDGNPTCPLKKKEIEPLTQVDHSKINYDHFLKNFYQPHEDILNLNAEQLENLRQTLGIKVSGPEPPNPVTSFAHFGFDETLMKSIRKAGFTQPTSIQAQAIPTALSGRDLIGIAKTGSGKTAAFVWSMLIHIVNQSIRRKEEGTVKGPVGLILTPTRELALQIYNEAKKFSKPYDVDVVCCYGGGTKWEQSKALEKGPEIVVATPGRMIDMVKTKSTNLLSVTFLVLDEADRMFNMGFEPQVRSICNNVRPDRQTLLFSATFKKRVEKLARDVLTDPIRIVQGGLGEANQDVTQYVHVLANTDQKQEWLYHHMVEFLSNGSLLIFVTKKADAEVLANNLIVRNFNCLFLHGDMDQADRNKVITGIKKRQSDILVATDVASRGLDIPHIGTVVNYDIARDIDTHTHRIGRTGRAGKKGKAYTLVTEKDKEFAGHLVRNLEGANQEVPKELMDLSLKSSWFKNSRFNQSKNKLNIGGFGLGYTQKTGNKQIKSISNPTLSAGINEVPATGPVTNRYSAMREAFRAQYMSQFHASSDRTWENTSSQIGIFATPSVLPTDVTNDNIASIASLDNLSKERNERNKSKKSRWN